MKSWSNIDAFAADSRVHGSRLPPGWLCWWCPAPPCHQRVTARTQWPGQDQPRLWL